MGRKEDILEKVRGIAEPLAAAEGLELVDLEFAGGGGQTILRLYIDRAADPAPAPAPAPDPEQGLPRVGVTLEDCANISRSLSAALDVEDPIVGRYELEVSSPGLDRPLRTQQHFERYAGSKVRVKTFGPLSAADNRKTFIGKLVGYQEGKVVVNVDGAPFLIPHDQIAKANIEYEFDTD